MNTTYVILDTYIYRIYAILMMKQESKRHDTGAVLITIVNLFLALVFVVIPLAIVMFG